MILALVLLFSQCSCRATDIVAQAPYVANDKATDTTKTDVGAPLDGLRERIEKRREERDEPTPPVVIDEIHEQQERKPRPFVQGLARAFRGALGWVELPARITLGYYLTLGTIVFAFTCGLIRTIVVLRAKRAKR